MTPEQELQRAASMERLLDDPLFKEARANLASDLAQLRASVPIADTLMHTRLIMLEQIAAKFFGYFEFTAQTGKLAKLQLDELEQRRKTLGDRLRIYQTLGRSGF